MAFFSNIYMKNWDQKTRFYRDRLKSCENRWGKINAEGSELVVCLNNLEMPLYKLYSM